MGGVWEEAAGQARPIEHPGYGSRHTWTEIGNPLAGGENLGHYKEFMGRLTDDLVQQTTRKQAVSYRLPAVHAEVLHWWEAPLSICRLG